jgi:hypothetical protein
MGAITGAGSYRQQQDGLLLAKQMLDDYVRANVLDAYLRNKPLPPAGGGGLKANEPADPPTPLPSPK